MQGYRPAAGSVAHKPTIDGEPAVRDLRACAMARYTQVMAASMRDYLQRIATGPALSKDLSRDEARDGMARILRGEVHEVQAAIFLIALRMKRETDDECLGVLDALRDAAQIATAGIDDVVDLEDPFDGFVRHLPAAAFLPALLAACGAPAVAHGCRDLAPKHGVGSHRVLAAAGVEVSLSPAAAAARLADPACGWAYVDLAQSCPRLDALSGLRELIVKRPVLSTVEKLIAPVRGRQHTHLVVGYVHAAYETLLARLAALVGYTSALVVKGVEGGVVPPLAATASAYGFSAAGELRRYELDPAPLGLGLEVRAPPLADELAGPDAIAAAAAARGLAALDGAAGPTRDALVHAASAILAFRGLAASREQAAARARAALDDGSARARFR
jgi:anthranilate phosphoribosyltransferase